MKLKELFETPLPDDWDKDIYNDRVPFKTRVAYAKERAARIGQGSSRVAFMIPYQGRRTILKIAKNRKGMMQNREEAMILSDRVAQHSGILIPIIDYDERSSTPTWIHMEKAEKVSQAQLRSLFNDVPMYHIVAYLNERLGIIPNNPFGDLPDEIYDNDYYLGLEQLVSNFDGIIHPDDLASTSNWGLYHGRPVIIDIGFTYEVSKVYRG